MRVESGISGVGRGRSERYDHHLLGLSGAYPRHRSVLDRSGLDLRQIRPYLVAGICGPSAGVGYEQRYHHLRQLWKSGYSAMGDRYFMNLLEAHAVELNQLDLAKSDAVGRFRDLEAQLKSSLKLRFEDIESGELEQLLSCLHGKWLEAKGEELVGDISAYLESLAEDSRDVMLIDLERWYGFSFSIRGYMFDGPIIDMNRFEHNRDSCKVFGEQRKAFCIADPEETTSLHRLRMYDATGTVVPVDWRGVATIATRSDHKGFEQHFESIKYFIEESLKGYDLSKEAQRMLETTRQLLCLRPIILPKLRSR